MSHTKTLDTKRSIRPVPRILFCFPLPRPRSDVPFAVWKLGKERRPLAARHRERPKDFGLDVG